MGNTFWSDGVFERFQFAGPDGQFKVSAQIFPMTKKDAFKQTWSDVADRAGITDLTFHDLRREAGSRFDEAGLTKGEHDLMMGHRNGDMTSLYIHADLKAIQNKLDNTIGATFEVHDYPDDIGEDAGRCPKLSPCALG